MQVEETPAEAASRKALEAIYACLDASESFRLEAGAGAGKTYSLVEALRYLIKKYQRSFPRHSRRIACITYTNVATEEIKGRIDKSPLVFCDTNHAFCWSLISGFQKQLRELIAEMPEWQERIEEAGGLGSRSVTYTLGFRSIREEQIFLHHNDILPLTIALMENRKFRRILVDQFPIILIDEYQDTDRNWIEAIKKHFLGQAEAPLFGFFGDHWQKIYGNGCGRLVHPAIKEIGKEANFRSVETIVDCLNRMRPALPQNVEMKNSKGQVTVFHTNDWKGARQTANHWQGDLPADTARQALQKTRSILSENGWSFGPDTTKILMLTHRVLASEQGYASLPEIFKYNDAFAKKEHPYIAYFVDVIEPACDAFANHKYGAMFEALGASVAVMKGGIDKRAWSNAMQGLNVHRDKGTVGDVVNYLRKAGKPYLPDSIQERERELDAFDKTAGEKKSSALEEIESFKAVPYSEVKSLHKYLVGYSPFETKHGVKGAEFENVLVVIGRGWNQYNFNEMLELSAVATVPAKRASAYERNRNLFYVACSRPKKRLALLFTQQLSSQAMQTLAAWFGPDSVEALAL